MSDNQPTLAPNFLIFVTDQLPASALSYAGHPVVSTPNIDELAARGTVFTNAFVASPSCMPNRASMMTGRLPSSHGVRVNGLPLDPSSDTFVRALRRHGYRTGAAGKMHLQPYGANPGPANDLAGTAPDSIDASLSRVDWEARTTHEVGFVPLPANYYGFDQVDLVLGAGDTAQGHYRHWLAERVDPTTVQGHANALTTLESWPQVYQTAVPAEFYPTTYIAQATNNFLDRVGRAAHTNDSAPFAYWCSFPDPHHPFCPPAGYFDRYSAADVALPATWNQADDTHFGVPPQVRALWDRRGKQSQPFDCFAPTEEQVRAALAAAYGMIEMIDDAIGSVMTTLDRHGLRESTVVIFTSDHGDMFGEHGLLLKHGVHYDACTRVPLVIDVPSSAHRTDDALASSLDLAPTVLELAGVSPMRDGHGVSLADRVAGAVETNDRHLLIEEDEVFSIPGLVGPFAMRTLLTSTHRLTHYGGLSFGELYDRRGDQAELTNLFDRAGAAAVRGDLYRQLTDAITQHADRGRPPRYFA